MDPFVAEHVGYWNNPEATARTITADGWLKSGDAGYLDEEGYIYLHDRVKDMIVSGGENVYPAEVENVLMTHEDVADVAVIGVPDERWGEAVKAVVVPRPGPPHAEDLIASPASGWPASSCPSRSTSSRCCREPRGKLLKRELREPYWEGVDRRIG